MLNVRIIKNSLIVLSQICGVGKFVIWKRVCLADLKIWDFIILQRVLFPYVLLWNLIHKLLVWDFLLLNIAFFTC